MGTPVIRLGDMSKGHVPWGPNSPVEGSPNVFANSKAVVRNGDKYALHSNGPSPHPEVAIADGTVYANGKAVHKVGNVNSCSDETLNGSPDVFIG